MYFQRLRLLVCESYSRANPDKDYSRRLCPYKGIQVITLNSIAVWSQLWAVLLLARILFRLQACFTHFRFEGKKNIIVFTISDFPHRIDSTVGEWAIAIGLQNWLYHVNYNMNNFIFGLPFGSPLRFLDINESTRINFISPSHVQHNQTLKQEREEKRKYIKNKTHNSSWFLVKYCSFPKSSSNQKTWKSILIRWYGKIKMKIFYCLYFFRHILLSTMMKKKKEIKTNF